METALRTREQGARIEAIDLVKGIGILCIVFGHVFPVTLVTQCFFAFHVPIFFLASGYTYRKDGNQKRFYGKKLKRLLVPYFCFSLISILLLWAMAKLLPVSEESRILPNLLGMLWGNSNGRAMAWNTPLWFLPCMFCAVVLMDLFESLLSKTELSKHLYLRLTFVLSCWAAGMVLNTVLPVYLPWHLETAVFLAGFSELGLLLRQWKKGELPYWGILLLTAAGIGASLLNGWTDIRTHTFGRYPVLLVVTTLCFSCAIFGASTKLKHCRWLSYLGRHSLSILLMHKFPILFFRDLIPHVQELLDRPTHPLGILCGIAVTALTVGLCLLAERIILPVFPIAFGSAPVKRR